MDPLPQRSIQNPCHGNEMMAHESDLQVTRSKVTHLEQGLALLGSILGGVLVLDQLSMHLVQLSLQLGTLHTEKSTFQNE